METIAGVFKAHDLEFNEAEFAGLVEEALRAGGGFPPYPDPAKHFSAEELEILASGGFKIGPPPPPEDDPFIRGAFEYALLRITALSSKQAAELLGVRDSRIRQRLAHRELYGIKIGDEWRLPRFQFTSHGLVPGLDRVFPSLNPELSPVSVVNWLFHKEPDLETPDSEQLSPIEWLLAGHPPEKVAELARWL